MHARTAVVAATVLLSAVSVGGRQSDQEALVNRFYPRWLADEAEADFKAGGPPPFRAVAFASADLDGTGRESYIVAAFTNGFGAAVSVLAKRGDSAVEIAAPRFPLMLGIEPNVRLLDLDRDGRPEIIVSLSSAKGNHAEWIFKWDGRTLTSIADEVDRDGNASAVIVDGEYIDLDGDGMLEIVNSDVDFNPNDPSDLPEYDVYSLVKGKYTLTRTLSFIGTFALPAHPGATQQDVLTDTFAVRDTTAAYQMTILNGDEDGSHRVTSADIFVNGVRVAGSLSRGGDRRIVNARLKRLAVSNTIRTVLRGPRPAWLTIAIGPVSAGAR